jgi:hypothetical protein
VHMRALSGCMAHCDACKWVERQPRVTPPHVTKVWRMHGGLGHHERSCSVQPHSRLLRSRCTLRFSELPELRWFVNREGSSKI